MTKTSSNLKVTGGEPRPAEGQTAASVLAGAFSDFEHHAAVAEAAYYLALARGFAPGQELADWLAAEKALEDERPRLDH
jgi:hypothetical protein